MIDTYIWGTAAVIQETKDTVTVVFDTYGETFSYKPGQFIHLTLNIGGAPVTRSYSLSSSPEEDLLPSITVKKIPGGTMSGYIVEKAAVINTWQVSGPHGGFTLPEDIYNVKQLVLLAGGSGITPLFSIARAFVKRFPEAAVTLIYSSRSEEEIIFREQIADWAGKNKGNVRIHYALSQEENTTELTGATLSRGRINKLVARKVIKTTTTDPLDDIHYFICGPSELMKMHQEMLTALQVPEERICLEWFAPEAGSQNAALPEDKQEVLLHFYEQTNLLEVDAGKNILAAALEEKIPLPFSCKAGTCGICAARLISGKVTMLNNFALRKTAVDEGWVLLCQSYPLTPDVTVEII